MEKNIKELEAKTAAPDFWEDREKAEKTIIKLNSLKKRYEPWKELKQEFDDLEGLYRLAREESDESIEKDLITNIAQQEREFEKLRVLELLGEELDDRSAFLTIHSGQVGRKRATG